MDAVVQQKSWNRLRWRPKSVEVFSSSPQVTRSSPENPSVPIGQWFDEHDGYGALAGVSVTNESAMRQIAVLACVRLHAESLGTLPLSVYRRTSAGGKDRADDHDVYPVLHDAWNEYQTSTVGRETMHAQVVLRGNAYALIERDNGGFLVGLWPVPPGCIEPVIEGGKLWYRITQYGTQALGVRAGVYAPKDVLHIPGLGFDGIKGYNPIQLAREAIGLTAAAEAYGAGFYGNGARAGGVLESDQPIQDTQLKTLKKQWDELHSGVYNSHKVAILSNGLKYHAISVNPEEAQFLDTRKFQLTEVARLFNTPPAMIGASTGDSQTYANHEQRMLQFAMMSLRPWCVKWEQEINRKLFTPRESSRYFAEFNLDALLRADIKTRYESYNLGLDRWLTRNEIRDLENRNPVDGGDDFKEPKPVVMPAGAKA
jgi:HK97 family phage portal protein